MTSPATAAETMTRPLAKYDWPRERTASLKSREIFWAIPIIRSRSRLFSGGNISTQLVSFHVILHPNHRLPGRTRACDCNRIDADEEIVRRSAGKVRSGQTRRGTRQRGGRGMRPPGSAPTNVAFIRSHQFDSIQSI